MTSKGKSWKIVFTITIQKSLIYPSVRYKQMHPSTVPALRTALDIHDVMLARTPCRLHIRAKITKAELVKESGKKSNI